MNTPDLTKAQLLVLARAIIAVLIAFGVGLNPAQQTALLGLAGSLGAVTLLADAIIRHGRSRALTPAPAVIDLTPARRTTEPTARPVADAVTNAQTFTVPPAAAPTPPTQPLPAPAAPTIPTA